MSDDRRCVGSVRRERHGRSDRRARSRLRLDSHAPVHKFEPFLHADQAETRRRQGGFGVEPFAQVAHGQLQVIVRRA